MREAPLVSIGIPTYNRAASVERAIRSALAQDHPALEVIVSDDDSTDETPAVLRALAARDPRLRGLRQPVNLGHARNYQAVLEAARGEYFMWLSDDDWLDPGYVSSCLAVLRADPPMRSWPGSRATTPPAGAPSTSGRPTCCRPGPARACSPTSPASTSTARSSVSPGARTFAQRGFPDEVGATGWPVAAMAARGRVRTLRDVRIHRSSEGLGSDPEALARSFGMRGLAARNHHAVVALRIAREIATAPSYARLTPAERAVTAALSAALVVLRFPVYGAVMGALRRVGLGAVEDRLIALVRRRD